MHHCAQLLRREVAHNVADDGHTVKQLRATISRVDTRCNFQVTRDVARNVASCVRAFRYCALSIVWKNRLFQWKEKCNCP